MNGSEAVIERFEEMGMPHFNLTCPQGEVPEIGHYDAACRKYTSPAFIPSHLCADYDSLRWDIL